MIVLGVDPGTVSTGFGVVEAAGSRLTCLEMGDVRPAASRPMAERLMIIHDRIAGLIARHRPDAVAVEDTFIAKNPQTAIKLGQARGVILLAAAQAGIPAHGYAPTAVKQAVAGFGGADKAQVMFMVQRLLNLAEPITSDHAADALGLALCHHQISRFNRTVQAAGGRP